MAVLVTRPEPDNAATVALLRARGFEPLAAPVLHFQALPFRVPNELRARGVIVTSANALRAIAEHALKARLVDLPLFAVGERTAEAARAHRFAQVTSAEGSVASLRKLIGAKARKNAKAPLLYLAGADLSADLAKDLAADGLAVTTLTVYRMMATDRFPPAVVEAFAAHAIEAVLHYSRRSAQAFVHTIRDAGVEIAGLAVLQACLSEPVAQAMREAGAARVVVAERPEEVALLDRLERALRRGGA